MSRIESLTSPILRLFGIEYQTTTNREQRIQAMAGFFATAERDIKIVADGEELDEIVEALERAGILGVSPSSGENKNLFKEGKIS